MNDIAKQSASDKLRRAIDKEGVSVKEAGELIGIQPVYLSMFSNPKFWNKAGMPQWEKLIAWVNSGQSLKEYSVKHGKVVVSSGSGRTDTFTIGTKETGYREEVLRADSEDKKPSFLDRFKKKEVILNEKEKENVITDSEIVISSEVGENFADEKTKDPWMIGRFKEIDKRLNDVARGFEEIMQSVNNLAEIHEQITVAALKTDVIPVPPESQKVVIDIEINLVINGKKMSF